jgi:hypothetical protein
MRLRASWRRCREAATPASVGVAPVTGSRRSGRSVADFGGDDVALSGGDVGQLTREIEAVRNAGRTHVSVVTLGLGLDSIDAHIDYTASLSERRLVVATVPLPEFGGALSHWIRLRKRGNRDRPSGQ